MKIGIIGASDIAFRRFLPALEKCVCIKFAGVASRNISKRANFLGFANGIVYDGYDALLNDKSIDCVYVPLPPALHYEWVKKALEHGKHVMAEKPFTVSLAETTELIEIARASKLALHENYMFRFHSQLDWIYAKLPELGEMRLIRLDFGFPFRGADDFRYDKVLGGGALMDCGGYPLKLAALLLGNTAKITEAALRYKSRFEVDIFGSATLRNDDGMVAQISFGMDNSYRCSLDIWGSKGSLGTDRVFTAPANFEPKVVVKIGDRITEHILPSDDCFRKSIMHFMNCIQNISIREENYKEILAQSEIVEQFKEIAQ